MKLHAFSFFLFLFLNFSFSANAQDPRSSGTIELQEGFSAMIVLSPNGMLLQMEGPADRWLSVGFNAQVMAAGTDVVFYSNGSGGEKLYDGYLIGQGNPEEDEQQNWTVLENTVENGVRTVIASRALDTGDPDDFVFDYDAPTLPIIWAHGASASLNLGFHQSNRGADVAQFTSVTNTTQTPRLENLIKLYPNPASAEINVEFEASTNVNAVRIFDSNARLLQSIDRGLEQGTLKVSVDQWPAGIYYFEANSDKDRALLRFVIE